MGIRRFNVNGIGRGNDDKKKDKLSVLTKETLGMTLFLFSAVIFFIAVTGPYVFGSIGVAITSFFIGLCGFFVYPLLLLVMALSIAMVLDKKLPLRAILRVSLLVVAVFFIVHTATAERFFGAGFGSYLTGCWQAASESAAKGTGGGVLFGLIAYPLRLLSAPGAYIILALCTLLALYNIARHTAVFKALAHRGRKGTEPRRPNEERSSVSFEDLDAPERAPIPEAAPAPTPAPAPAPAPAPEAVYDDPVRRSREILFRGDPAQNYRTNLIFDSGSAFNRGTRRTNIGYTGSDRSASTAPDLYSGSFSEQAENVREPMPKRVVKPETDEEDFNYPAVPSFRAPSAPSSGAHDYYSHDVDTEYSSQPNVFDEPDEPDETTPPAPMSEEEGPQTDPPRSFLDPYGRKSETDDSPLSSPEEETARTAPPAPDSLPRREEPPRTAPPVADPYLRRASAPAPGPSPRREEPPETPVRREDPAPFLRRGADLGTGPSLRRDDEGLRRGDDRFSGGEDAFSDRRDEGSNADLFDDEGDFREATREEPLRGLRSRSERGMGQIFDAPRAPASRAPQAPTPSPAPAPDPAPVPKKHIYPKYNRPNTMLFKRYDDVSSVPPDEILRNSEIITDTLKNFKIDADVVKVTCGPAVTRYDIDIPKNVPVSNVTRRANELGMRLRVRDGVSAYVNNATGAISIEVPNVHRATVGIFPILQSDEYINAKPGSLVFAIGKDVDNRNICGNIVKMKHLLVAGSTGSGKSVCLNAMLISLICRYSPEDLRLILIDPKKVEFAVYAGLPHLMINEIINEPQKAVSALNWAIKEMERRYGLFEKKTKTGINVHNVDEYNAALTEDEEKLPKIVIVVDELADLMAVAKKDIEDRVGRLTAKARAAGIHLVIATQRPSVDVITGVIKGNLPTRIAFRTIQEVDSRTILDESGAEKLLGLGDMLFRTEGMFNCLRVQGAFLSSEEVQAIIEDIKAHNEAYFDDSVSDYINREGAGPSPSGGDYADDGGVDGEYIRALGIVVKLGQASISLIQRKCSVGYNHAGKIIEWMEAMGYISPFDGKAKAREVLLTKEEYEAKYGSLD